MNNGLAPLNKARKALALMTTPKEAKDYLDKATAIRDYYGRQEGAFELANEAAEIMIWARRRLGELFAEVPRDGGGRPGKTHPSDGTSLQTIIEDLGVGSSTVHRWQQEAGVPEERLLAWIEKTRPVRILTADGVRKLAKQHEACNVKTNNDEEADESSVIKNLYTLVKQKKQFGCIYADPPWKYGNQGTRASTDNHYQTMTVEEIAAEPVAQLSADNCHLHLWTTNGFLFEAREIMEAWGFKYKSAFVWVKPQMGMGNYWRLSHEFMLLGVKGSLPFREHNLMSWIEADRTKHSRKPRVVREMIERASPGPYLELYGREEIEGWTVYGNQIERTLFNA